MQSGNEPEIQDSASSGTEMSSASEMSKSAGQDKGAPDDIKIAQEFNTNEPEAYMKGISEMIERKNVLTLKETLGGAVGLGQLHGTNLVSGLHEDQVSVLREKYGINQLKQKPHATFMQFLIEALADAIIIHLIVAAIISIIFGLTLSDPNTGKVNRETGWIEGVAILISVAVVVLMGSINNYQKAKKFEELEADQAKREVQVIRDGVQKSVDSTEVVVGDVLEVESGIQFTCDCVYISGTELKTNESAMTGEPDIIKKSIDSDPFFISGTQLDDGAGRLYVVAVGQRSYQGTLKDALDEEAQDTPLQVKLAELADDIGKLGGVIAAVLLAALIIKEIILITTQDKEASASSFLRFVIVAITIIVVAIPEGLPLAVTISLAFSMKAMLEDKCLVRILASCETMGGATSVCSDKTGTLTENKMTVVQGYIMGSEFIIEGYGLSQRPRSQTIMIPREGADFQTSRGGLSITSAMLNEFCFALSINSSARQEMREDPSQKAKTLQWVGNKTEHGLLGFCNFVSRDYSAQRAEVPAENKKQFPFNSSKKRMTTLVRGRSIAESGIDLGDEDVSASNTLVRYTKGASELVLEDCDRYITSEGRVERLTPALKEEMLQIITSMADQGNRTIGVAVGKSAGVKTDSTMDAGSTSNLSEFPEAEPSASDLVFLGVLGIQDPIRMEVPDAVDDCESAGIRVRMVTGDNKNTAIAIAKKARIYTDPVWDVAMTGQEFREKYDNNKEELYDIIPRLRILARSSPSDKHKLVGMLQDIGDVVAVTGDGTNDAPALKLANVGFAMNSGTDIAKGAADMVLMDDNFASVINACKWGRAVNDNIRKFLQYQLSINIGGVVLTVISSLASPTSKEVFAPVQLLWLNLIMDTMAALALATERPERESLKRPPVYKQAPLLSNKMRVFMGVHSTFQTILILLLLFLGHNWFQTIENPESCSTTDPSFYSEFDIVNATTGETAKSARHVLCEEACKFEGGTLDGRFCQQGRIHSTIIFNTFIFMQAFNIFNARKLYFEFNVFSGLIDRSIVCLLVFFVICIFQAFAVELFGRFMGTIGLSWDMWLICLGLSFVEVPLGVIVRLLPVTDKVPDEVIQKAVKEEELRAAVIQQSPKKAFY